MFTPKIKIPKESYENLNKIAELSGYSSTEEFILHVLEKEVGKLGEDDDEEKIKDRLKGLGYIS